MNVFGTEGNDVWQAQPEEQHQWTFTEDPPSTFDPAHNTHLWLVFQGAKLAANDPVYGSAIVNTIQPSDGYINDTAHIFHNALCQGIWDADEKDAYNGPALRDVYSNYPMIPEKYRSYLHHFYDPDSHKNYGEDEFATAYTEAVAYFRESIRFWSAHNFQDSGYFLGLALHFFTDVTQPMHASNFTDIYNYSDSDWQNGKFGLNRKHRDFEEFANTLIGDDIWNGKKPPLYLLDSVDQPGICVDLAAHESKPFINAIVTAMDKDNWQATLTPLIDGLFWNATSRTAQFLRVWMMHAQKAWNPNGDDRITISGPMSISCFKEPRQQVVVHAIDQGGVFNETLWNPDGVGSWWNPRTTIQGILLEGVNLQDGSMAATSFPINIYIDHVFTVTNTNHLMRTIYQGNGFFSQWEDLGAIAADPSQSDSAQAASLVVIQGHNPIDLFCISAEGDLLHGCTDGNFTWQGWENLRGADEAGLINELYRLEGNSNDPTLSARVSSLAACKRIDLPDFMDVFAISQNGWLMQKCWDGYKWLGWNRVGQPTDGGGLRVQAGSLCCIVGDPNGKANYLDVFAISVEGHLLHAFWENDKWYWQDLQGTTLGNGLAGSLVVSNVYNPLDVLAVTTDGFIVHKVWNGTTWQDWVRLI